MKSLMKFIRKMDENMEFLEMDPDMAQRYLNRRFLRWGEKRNEILQLMMIEPKSPSLTKSTLVLISMH